ncbi:hypothetical protein [Streptomyces sp. NPDC054838]
MWSIICPRPWWKRVVAGVAGDGVLDGNQDPGGEGAVVGVLDVAADGQDRNFFGLGVEVAGDDDPRVGAFSQRRTRARGGLVEVFQVERGNPDLCHSSPSGRDGRE